MTFTAALGLSAAIQKRMPRKSSRARGVSLSLESKLAPDFIGWDHLVRIARLKQRLLDLRSGPFLIARLG
jgi:hypothetical protein